jgi:hypothetical protein
LPFTKRLSFIHFDEFALTQLEHFTPKKWQKVELLEHSENLIK